jgi:hypothetical protein
MEMDMKTLIITLALAALIAATTSTRTALAANNEVWIGSLKIGADPDATVRLQLRRDYRSY